MWDLGHYRVLGYRGFKSFGFRPYIRFGVWGLASVYRAQNLGVGFLFRHPETAFPQHVFLQLGARPSVRVCLRTGVSTGIRDRMFCKLKLFQHKTINRGILLQEMWAKSAFRFCAKAGKACCTAPDAALGMTEPLYTPYALNPKPNTLSATP